MAPWSELSGHCQHCEAWTILQGRSRGAGGLESRKVGDLEGVGALHGLDKAVRVD